MNIGLKKTKSEKQQAHHIFHVFQNVLEYINISCFLVLGYLEYSLLWGPHIGHEHHTLHSREWYQLKAYQHIHYLVTNVI